MESLSRLLTDHYAAFPKMEVQDAVKFLYQHFMGPGHLIRDEETALARLNAEWDALSPDASTPLSCPIGNGLHRLNLSACKAFRLSSKTVAKLFSLTAGKVTPDHDGLERSLDLLFSLPFPRKAVEKYLTDYRAEGCPMVSHSQSFCRHYSPAYRIVSEQYINIIPAVLSIDRVMASQSRLLVAIDGPCASGKSTLGSALAEIYNCPLIHMDDFFLRPEQRTPQRLAQPGGNVDHERFSREVLTPLLAGASVRYRPFLCHSGQFGPEVMVPASPMTVVEGCYCLRPDLRDAFDVRIWLEAPWETRRQRLLARDGADSLSRFEQQWIPLENNYFDHFHVAECCHVQLIQKPDI